MFSIDYVPTMVGVHKFTATYSNYNQNVVANKAVTISAADPVITPTEPTTPTPPTVPSKTATSMALTLTSSSVEVGSNMHANGVLTGSAGIAGATVALKVTLPDGSTVNPTQGSAVTTDSTGKFSIDYVPTKVGTYKFTATYAGNSQYSGSEMTASPAARDPAQPPSNPAPVGSYKYIVTVEGSTYYAKNAATGATISSGTNAATVIQSALNALTSGRTAKEAVLLQGSFVISKAISIPSYTILELDGKVTWGTSSVGYMLTATDKNNFEVKGGEWDGNKGIRSTTSSSNPMNFMRCNDVVISNLKVHDGPYDNIEFLYSERVTIRGVESYRSNWDSFMMAFCNNCVVENCHIYDIAQGGCYFYCEDDGIAQTINNNIMRNNLVERTLTSGLSLSPRGAEDRVVGGLIEGNTLIDCGTDGDHPAINTGFSVRGQGTIIRNNVISCPAGLSGAGIEFGVDNGQCTGNTISGTGEAGLSITGSGNTITGNTIRNCGSQGYPGLSNRGSNNVVTGNTVA
ncbi:MAG: right-handed parallel beta-helix repeat-containing protein [Methanomassiliicoccus sp.]|nr:right-handed parallel beta-helix repeat-containing protein [Methanomassiliicoccus sp.]